MNHFTTKSIFLIRPKSAFLTQAGLSRTISTSRSNNHAPPHAHRDHNTFPNKVKLDQGTTSSPSSSSEQPTGSSASTISKSETDHFNKLSSTWWNELGSFGLLHRMNPVRIKFIKDRLLYDVSPVDPLSSTNDVKLRPSEHHQQDLPDMNKHSDSFRFLQNKRVLDVGCGGGIFSEVLARLGGDVLGIDATEGCIQAAGQHARLDPHFNPSGLDTLQVSSKPHLNYLQTSAESLLQSGNDDHREAYDLVCAMEVIEHVENPTSFLASLAELAKPGGHVILSTISRTPLSRFLTITLAESEWPLIGIVPPGTHTYSKFIKPEEVTEFFRGQLGWAKSYERSDLEVRGSIYDPLAAKWKLLSRDAPWGGWGHYYFGVKKPL